MGIPPVYDMIFHLTSREENIPVPDDGVDQPPLAVAPASTNPSVGAHAQPYPAVLIHAVACRQDPNVGHQGSRAPFAVKRYIKNEGQT